MDQSLSGIVENVTVMNLTNSALKDEVNQLTSDATFPQREIKAGFEILENKCADQTHSNDNYKKERVIQNMLNERHNSTAISMDRQVSQTSNAARADECLDVKNPYTKCSRPAICVDRYKKFKECFRHAYDNAPKANGLAHLKTVKEAIQQRVGCAVFTDDEMSAAFKKLEDENACMRVGKHIVVI
ncbi:CBR-MCM-3 protein [Ditylenchus destructor]|nr:CBR-MCM-3 protein [Ditylenchus destructor]